MSWRAGDLILKDFGFKQSKKIRAIERKLWAAEADIDYDHETDTHARSGEFDNMLQVDLKNIKKKANGKEIFASPDEEYFSVSFFFGSEDEIVAKLGKLLVKQKRTNEDAKFTESLTKELADELGNKFADVPASGRTWSDRKWIDTYSNGKHVPDKLYIERNDGWHLRFHLSEKTVTAHHVDITTSEGGKYSKEQVLNTIGDVERFIEKLGPDIPKRPWTFSETQEEALYQLVKPLLGGDFPHFRDQGNIYFGGCKACLITTGRKYNDAFINHDGHVVSLSRENVGSDKGRLYLSVGKLSSYATPPDPVGYMNDASLKGNLIKAIRMNKVSLAEKVEEAKSLIESLNAAQDSSDQLLKRLEA